MTVLVTGGAGYIGSHTTYQLIEKGHKVVIVDNLYSGHRWAVHPQAVFYESDLANVDLLKKIIAEHQIKALIHFGAYTIVPESIENPLKYYENNIYKSAVLLQTCQEAGVNQVIFSSSAATYGEVKEDLVTEQSPTEPINAYGYSKLATEYFLKYLTFKSPDFRYIALRYFNVAGARVTGEIGQATPRSTHLIKIACEVATQQREFINVFGTDYNTPDGTCVRDYIHVDDLAAAHLCALGYLHKGGGSNVYNCGYGKGYSVKQVLEMMNKVIPHPLSIKESPRRPGDPSKIVADSTRIQKDLGWRPQYDDLRLICETAYKWEVKLKNRN